LLRDACDALKELSRLGGAGLFWDDSAMAATSDARIHRARDRIEVFQQRIDAIEDRRRALLVELTQQQDRVSLLEDDLFDAQEEAEQLKHEWIIEREIDAIRSRAPMMPWTRGGEDDRRFRKSVATALMIMLVFALILPMIPLPFPTEQKAEVPERVVTLIPEKHVVPPPPPPEQVKPPERVVQQKPVEKPLQQRSAKPDKQPQPEDVEGPEQGILAFREKLAAFKEAPVVARLGSQAHINKVDDSVSPAERSMLTTNAPGSSGGIKLASLSRDFGRNGGGERNAIQGGALTRASSHINSIAPAAHPLSGGPGLARTDEEIQIVFDRYKSSLYRLYNRELRKDPTLQGKIILRLTIEPDGTVSFCQLQSTDMNAPELSAQVVDRVKTFDFGAKEVPAITIIYPIDFLPAA
jgi:outer membrane biosynthesis protein TonB